MIISRIVLVIAAILGFQGAVLADEADDGIIAFIEACVRTSPDFQGGRAAMERRGLPIFEAAAVLNDQLPTDLPAVFGVWGPISEVREGQMCGVVIKGNADRSAAATVQRYLEDESFSFEGTIERNVNMGIVFGQAGLAARYPLPNNGLLGVVVSKGSRFDNFGRGTLLAAMSGVRPASP